MKETWEFTLRKQSASLNSLQISGSMLALSDVVKHDKGVQTGDMYLEHSMNEPIMNELQIGTL